MKKKRLMTVLAVAAIILVTLASAILTFEGTEGFEFNAGSLLVLAASCCWGLENNCTRMLSSKSSVEITVIKGLCCGAGSLVLALLAGEKLPEVRYLLTTMVLGFVAYGLSINFYIKAQKDLGAAKTSAYYSVAPFLGVAFGMLLGERPGIQFYLGLLIMAIATVLMVKDTIALQHTHAHTHVHCHPHRHGDLVHCHPHSHTHEHTHIHTEEGSQHTHEVLEGHEEEIPEHFHTHPADL